MSAIEDWPQPKEADDFTTPNLELAVLRGLMWSKARRKGVFDLLSAEDFTIGAHSSAFQVMADLHHDRSDLTFATITDELDRRGWLDHVPGSLVWGLRHFEYEGDPLLLATYLSDHVRRRRLQATASEIAREAGTKDFDSTEAAERLLAHTRQPREYGIDRPEDLRDAVMERLRDGADRGTTTGFGEFDQMYRAAKGLLTIVTGVPSAGKSTFIDGVTVNLAAKNDWRFAVFSPESAPTERHMERLAAMRMGEKFGDHTTDAVIDKGLGFVNDHYEWINSTEGVSVAEILRRAEVIHRRRPINGLVIDPWNEVDHVRDRQQREDEYISSALTLVRRFARRHGIHVWVIAHPTKLQRKADGNYDTPTLYDVAGGAQWRNKADMGLVVNRDFTNDIAPTKVHVVKVRFADHGRIGTAKVYYHAKFEGFAADAPQGWQGGAI